MSEFYCLTLYPPLFSYLGVNEFLLYLYCISEQQNQKFF